MIKKFYYGVISRSLKLNYKICIAQRVQRQVISIVCNKHVASIHDCLHRERITYVGFMYMLVTPHSTNLLCYKWKLDNYFQYLTSCITERPLNWEDRDQNELFCYCMTVLPIAIWICYWRFFLMSWTRFRKILRDQKYCVRFGRAYHVAEVFFLYLIKPIIQLFQPGQCT